jgi:hypothetical protein
MMATLGAVPESMIPTRDLMKFLPKLSLEEAAARFHAIDDFSTREGEMALFQYAQLRFFDDEFEWGRNDGAEKLAEIEEVNHTLPLEMQGQFLYGLLAGSFSRETAMGVKQRTFDLLDLLDLMVEGENWAHLERAQFLVSVQVDPEERAAWAVNLPERAETAEVFEMGISPYLRRNGDQTWEWIQGFPDGMWRDRALAKYSETMLGQSGQFENLRKTMEAIELIKDAEIREGAEGLHALYERANQ